MTGTLDLYDRFEGMAEPMIFRKKAAIFARRPRGGRERGI